MDDIRGNSNASKKQQPEQAPREAKEPVTNNVVVKKESELKKFGKQFFTEDAKSVKGHVFMNVIVPGLQKLISDMVKSGVDWLIYGIKGGGQQSNGNIRNISYTGYYDSPNRRSISYGNNQQQATRPGAYSVSEIMFNDRGEAEETLLRMRESISRYGTVTVADFYDLVSIKSNYTDVKYGWRDLRDAEVQRSGNGYYIKFPRIVPVAD